MKKMTYKSSGVDIKQANVDTHSTTIATFVESQAASFSTLTLAELKSRVAEATQDLTGAVVLLGSGDSDSGKRERALGLLALEKKIKELNRDGQGGALLTAAGIKEQVTAEGKLEAHRVEAVKEIIEKTGKPVVVPTQHGDITFAAVAEVVAQAVLLSNKHKEDEDDDESHHPRPPPSPPTPLPPLTGLAPRILKLNAAQALEQAEDGSSEKYAKSAAKAIRESLQQNGEGLFLDDDRILPPPKGERVFEREMHAATFLLTGSKLKKTPAILKALFAQSLAALVEADRKIAQLSGGGAPQRRGRRGRWREGPGPC